MDELAKENLKYTTPQKGENQKADQLVEQEEMSTARERNTIEKLIKRRDTMLEDKSAQYKCIAKQNVELACKILKIDPKLRSLEQIQKTQELFKDNLFFADVRKSRDDKTYSQLCKNLRLEQFQRDEVVFQFGDQGTHLFIIIEGKVDIRVPAPVSLSGSQVEPTSLFEFIIDNYNDIYWKVVERQLSILEMIQTELQASKITIDQKGHLDVKQASAFFKTRMTSTAFRLHLQIHELVNPEASEQIVFQLFQTVKTLASGQNFGELALQYRQTREATVICTEETTLASLSRFDFAVVIGKEQRRKIRTMVDELKNYRIFSSLRPKSIARIHQYLQKKEYYRGQKIYAEGEKAVDHVYFITSGEFSVTKKVKQIDQGVLAAASGDKTELTSPFEKKIRVQPIRNNKVKEMIRNRSSGMLPITASLDAQPSASQLNKPAASKQYLQKSLHLYLLGKNEVFGLEEIVEMADKRAFTVTCSSTYGSCYTISKDQFRDCVNHFHFSDQVFQELLLKHSMFEQRVQQTHVFHQKFNQDQESQFRNAIKTWQDKADRIAKEQASRTPTRSQNQIDVSPKCRTGNNSMTLLPSDYIDYSKYDFSALDMDSRLDATSASRSPLGLHQLECSAAAAKKEIDSYSVRKFSMSKSLETVASQPMTRKQQFDELNRKQLMKYARLEQNKQHESSNQQPTTGAAMPSKEHVFKSEVKAADPSSSAVSQSINADKKSTDTPKFKVLVAMKQPESNNFSNTQKMPSKSAAASKVFKVVHTSKPAKKQPNATAQRTVNKVENAAKGTESQCDGTKVMNTETMTSPLKDLVSRQNQMFEDHQALPDASQLELMKSTFNPQITFVFNPDKEQQSQEKEKVIERSTLPIQHETSTDTVELQPSQTQQLDAAEDFAIQTAQQFAGTPEPAFKSKLVTGDDEELVDKSTKLLKSSMPHFGKKNVADSAKEMILIAERQHAVPLVATSARKPREKELDLHKKSVSMQDLAVTSARVKKTISQLDMTNVRCTQPTRKSIPDLHISEVEPSKQLLEQEQNTRRSAAPLESIEAQEIKNKCSLPMMQARNSQQVCPREPLQISKENPAKKLSKVNSQHDGLFLSKIDKVSDHNQISLNLPTIPGSSRHIDGMIKLSEHRMEISPLRNYFKSTRKQLTTNRHGGHQFRSSRDAAPSMQHKSRASQGTSDITMELYRGKIAEQVSTAAKSKLQMFSTLDPQSNRLSQNNYQQHSNSKLFSSIDQQQRDSVALIALREHNQTQISRKHSYNVDLLEALKDEETATENQHYVSKDLVKPKKPIKGSSISGKSQIAGVLSQMTKYQDARMHKVANSKFATERNQKSIGGQSAQSSVPSRRGSIDKSHNRANNNDSQIVKKTPMPLLPQLPEKHAEKSTVVAARQPLCKGKTSNSYVLTQLQALNHSMSHGQILPSSLNTGGGYTPLNISARITNNELASGLHGHQRAATNGNVDLKHMKKLRKVVIGSTTLSSAQKMPHAPKKSRSSVGNTLTLLIKNQARSSTCHQASSDGGGQYEDDTFEDEDVNAEKH